MAAILRRSARQYFPDSGHETWFDGSRADYYYPTNTRSFSGDVEYIDEVETPEYQARRGSLRNNAEQDQRPKCQPIGAQIDCR